MHSDFTRTPLEPESGVAEVRQFSFRGSEVLDVLRISYWTLGTLNDRRDNAILLCHGASGSKDWALPYCGIGSAFDPSKHFLISVDVPGGGESSRASTDPNFPKSYVIGDLVDALVALLEALGISRLRSFSGSSMAVLIGLDLAVRYPEKIGSLALWTGAHRSDGFADGLTRSLSRILDLDDGMAGFRAAAGAFLPAFRSRQGSGQMTRDEIDGLVDQIASAWANNWSASELAARYNAVGGCDLTAEHGGIESLASGIRCPLLMLLAETDLIFDHRSVCSFVDRVPQGQWKLIDSHLGHLSPAAPPGSDEHRFFNSETAQFINGL